MIGSDERRSEVSPSTCGRCCLKAPALRHHPSRKYGSAYKWVAWTVAGAVHPASHKQLDIEILRLSSCHLTDHRIARSSSEASRQDSIFNEASSHHQLIPELPRAQQTSGLSLDQQSGVAHELSKALLASPRQRLSIIRRFPGDWRSQSPLNVLKRSSTCSVHRYVRLECLPQQGV